ncbi:hypothetical protein KUCAC02_011658, partial [Chaenocephalus aceratus]
MNKREQREGIPFHHSIIERKAWRDVPSHTPLAFPSPEMYSVFPDWQLQGKCSGGIHWHRMRGAGRGGGEK